jgi:hypothetical protein
MDEETTKRAKIELSSVDAKIISQTIQRMHQNPSYIRLTTPLDCGVLFVKRARRIRLLASPSLKGLTVRN